MFSQIVLCVNPSTFTWKPRLQCSRMCRKSVVTQTLSATLLRRKAPQVDNIPARSSKMSDDKLCPKAPTHMASDEITHCWQVHHWLGKACSWTQIRDALEITIIEGRGKV
jgi:hypothetical protein